MTVNAKILLGVLVGVLLAALAVWASTPKPYNCVRGEELTPVGVIIGECCSLTEDKFRCDYEIDRMGGLRR